MSQRIRYVTEGENILRSTRNFPSNNGDVYVKFDKTNYTGAVYSAETDLAIASLSAKNLHGLKKTIKDTLTGLGVIFAVESRKTKVESENL